MNFVVLSLALLTTSTTLVRGSTAEKFNGGTIQFLGLNDGRGNVLFDPQGKKLPGVKLHPGMGEPTFTYPKLDVLVKVVTKASTEPSVGFLFAGMQRPGRDYVYPPGADNIWYAGMIRSFRKAGLVPFKVGVTTSPWKTVATCRARNGKLGSTTGATFVIGIVDPKAAGYGEFPRAKGRVVVRVNIPPSLANNAFQVIAFDAHGKELSGAGSRPANPILPTEYWFIGSLANTAKIALRTRKYEWFSFTATVPPAPIKTA